MAFQTTIPVCIFIQIFDTFVADDFWKTEAIFAFPKTFTSQY